jgi:hypothetical protein
MRKRGSFGRFDKLTETNLRNRRKEENEARLDKSWQFELSVGTDCQGGRLAIHKNVTMKASLPKTFLMFS